MGKSLLQGLEAAGRVVSTSRKQRAADTGARSVYLFLSCWWLGCCPSSVNLMQIRGHVWGFVSKLISKLAYQVNSQHTSNQSTLNLDQSVNSWFPHL